MQIIRKSRWLALMPTFLFPSLVYASDINDLRIEPSSGKMEVGEPLFIKVDLSYDTPRLHWRSGEPLKISKEEMLLEITHDGETEVVNPWGLSSGFGFIKKDTDGNQYGGYLPLFYRYNRDKKALPEMREKALFFADPGEYAFRLLIGEVASNLVTVEVRRSSAETSAALAILDHPIDFGFLISSDIKPNQSSEKRLRAIVEQCPSSVLATYASTRLGITKYNELFDQHNNKGGIVFRSCYGNLTKGLALPTGCPMREEALFLLACAEVIAGDYDKANQHAEMLTREYGDGRYQTKARELKSEIARIKQERGSEGEE